MRRRTAAAISGILMLLAGASAFAQVEDLDSVLQFEQPREREIVVGWGGGPPETIHFDSTVVHGGSGAARLERNADSPNESTTITKRLPIDFDGEWIELRGFLRTEGVSGFVGLWMREDGPSGPLQFDNMQSRGVRGTTEWTEYSIRLPLDPEARYLFFGALVAGVGTLWADDLQLIVDGKPIAEAPERKTEPTILDTDLEFDAGSRINAHSLSERQIEDVAALGRVWGFLKYHHPRVAAGEVQWDYELFRVLPEILDAADRDTRNRILSQWLDELGVPESCSPCAQAPTDAHLLPQLDWIKDIELLGPELSEQLQSVYANRFSGSTQFYVSQVAGVGNPLFEHELAYADQQPPDAGFRVLAALRLWNIIEYWFPYRDQIDSDWYGVLKEFLPRFVAADTWDSYRLELLALITQIQDTHANLWSSLEVRPPLGSCNLPVALRFVEGRATVIAFTDEAEGHDSGLEIADVIEAIDSRPVDSLIEEWSPYYSASNEPTRLRDIARSLPRGDCGESTLIIERRGESQEVVTSRLANTYQMPVRHDRPGETFQLPSAEVAYLKLSSIRVKDVEGYIEQAAGTKGLVIDIRNYPSEFVVFELGSRLVDKPTTFARFTVGSVDNPGSFTWTEPLTLEPRIPGYDGKIAILVDETSMSQAEYTAMALRAGPQAVVVGSMTAGADGNVSPIPLPGGLRTMISGIGVFYPDKTPTQRVGIVPDIVVTPTIDGIREGRDEVLEAALRHILGADADEEGIREIARPIHPTD